MVALFWVGEPINTTKASGFAHGVVEDEFIELGQLPRAQIPESDVHLPHLHRAEWRAILELHIQHRLEICHSEEW